MAYGPVGWVLNGVAIASGALSLSFASAELQEHFTGDNWMKFGLGDGLYTGLMIGNAVVGMAVNIAGIKYINSAAGQKAFDIQQNAKYWDKEK